MELEASIIKLHPTCQFITYKLGVCFFYSRCLMHADVEILTEIPCFKCLFWEPIKQSSLYCNPNECQKLTEWLIKNAENPQQDEVSLKVVSKALISTKKK